MKQKLIIAAIAAGVALPLSASAQAVVEETTTTTTETTTFTPEVQTKVVQYFDGYKAQPYGLPPTIVEQVPVQKLPTKWKTTPVTRGYVIPAAERTYLAPAPTELVQILPAAPASAKYFIMGGNVVAVDTSTMKVIDSVSVPTIKYEDDGDIEIKDGDTEIEIDEDGDVDVDD